MKNFKNFPKLTSKKLKLTLHPMFLILGVIMFGCGQLNRFLICTFSAVLHELGHSFVASKLGYQMQRIRLMPFGAELHGDTDSFDGKDEIYIALAGPLVNFFICLVILGLWWITPRIYNLTFTIFETNLALGLFNLFPLFPLDGGRVLLSIISQHSSRQKGAKTVKLITKIFAISLFVCFIITLFGTFNLSIGIMAFFMFFTATSSAKDAVYQKINLAKLVQSRCVQWVYVSVPSSTKLYELRRYHSKNRVTIFIILDKNNREIFRVDELMLERHKIQLNQALEVSSLQKFLI